MAFATRHHECASSRQNRTEQLPTFRVSGIDSTCTSNLEEDLPITCHVLLFVVCVSCFGTALRFDIRALKEEIDKLNESVPADAPKLFEVPDLGPLPDLDDLDLHLDIDDLI